MTDRIWPDWEGCFALSARPRDDELWSLASWWITLDDRIQLLFGWVFHSPKGSLRSEEWAMGHGHAKPKVRRLLLQARYEVIGGLLNRLANGDTLAKAAQELGLPELSSKLANASLGRVLLDRKAPRRGDAPDFVVAPWRLLPSRESFVEGMQSPVGDRPSMRAALVRIDKSVVLPPTEAEALSVLEYLERDTGLSFSPRANRGRDLSRLGDLELLTVKDLPERHASIEIRTSEDAIIVTLKAGLVPADAEALVRCRQDHAGATLADQILRSPATPASEVRALRFPTSPIGPSGAHVEVWVPSDDASLCLVHEHQAAFIRQLRLNLELLGTRFDLRSDWIERWSAQRRGTKGNLARADAMRAVQRRLGNNPSMVGEPDELWATAESNARELARRLAPPDSGGLWIGEERDKLRVWEWFRSTFEGIRDPGSLIIVDPYFDTMGLDIVARLNSTTRSIVAVTTLPSKENEANAKRERLQKLHTNLGPVFEDVDFSLYLVRPNRLHDRLVLELDRGPDDQQVPRRGFHLSNSLQSATDNHPLLITPIPQDLLADVADGIATMLEGLEPFLTRPKKQRSAAAPPRPRPTEKERTTAEEAVIAAARDDDTDRFARALAELSALLRHVPGNDSTFAREFVEHHGEAVTIASPLEQTLRQLPVEAKTGERAQELVGIAQSTRRPFETFSNASSTWTHGHWSLSGDPLLRFGTYLLFECSAAAFCRLWSDWSTPTEGGDAFARDLEQGRRLITILEILQFVQHTAGSDPVTDERLREVMAEGLRSRNAFVRAHLAAMLGLLLAPRLHDQDERWPAQVGHTVIAHLPDATERVLSIASWVCDLRVIGNQRGGVEPEPVAEALSRYFEWMIEHWPESVDAALLARIVERCEGPGRTGTWADTTLNGLLVPLAQQGKLSGAAVADYWLGQQEDRLERMLRDDYHFYAGCDIPLSEVYAWLLACSSHDLPAHDENDRVAIEARIKTSLTRLEELAAQAQRTLDRPFARTLAYESWSAAETTQRWLYGIALSALAYETLSPEIAARVRHWDLALDPATLDTADPTKLALWLRHRLRPDAA